MEPLRRSGYLLAPLSGMSFVIACHTAEWIEDAYTREMLAIEVDSSLPTLRVVCVLDRLRLTCGLPTRIVIDNGTEFTSKAMDQ
jgi:transposase InsO family protein